MILPSGLSTYSYAKSAAVKGWGTGWPNCSASADTVTVTLKLSGTKLYQIRNAISRLVQLLGDEVERRGYLFVPGWCWGGQCRPISGTKVSSNHSWGLAVDINAPRNGYNSTRAHDIPDWVFGLFRAYGFGVGADYTGSKQDWMHVEFQGTPADAILMTALAERAFTPLTKNPAPAPPPAAPTPPAPVPVPVVTADPQTDEDEDMLRLIKVAGSDTIWLVDFGAHTKWGVPDPAQYNWLRAVGIRSVDGDQAPWVIDNYRDISAA